MALRRRGSRGDAQVDRILNIDSGGIEEWEEPNWDYFRFEATPYRALDELIERYEPLDNAFLVDYGSGLGRINFYFHHKFGMPGYGIELHDGRIKQANENLKSYKLGLPRNQRGIQLKFIKAYAEKHEPDPRANTFFFFNPFSDQIYYDVLGKILDSLIEHDRPCDIILYYPSSHYMMLMASEPNFKLHQVINLDYSSDTRDCFMVYRHTP